MPHPRSKTKERAKKEAITLTKSHLTYYLLVCFNGNIREEVLM